MKQFGKNQVVWVYTYEYGLIETTFVKYNMNNTCYVKQNSNNITFVIELINVHKTEQLGKDYAIAINYKRGWLKREMERNPSIEYKNQLAQSIDSFPEMWI